jgi:LysM repeat protein
MMSSLTLLPKRLKASLALLLAMLLLATTIFLPGSTPLYAQSNGEQNAQEATVQRHNEIQTVIYVVKRGDTLGAIAKRYNTTVSILLRLNPRIHNANRLYIGQRLNVPAPAQEPNGFTKTRIYLVSLGDGGTLGCGDSLVPVTVDIPSTRAILRASLTKLLSLHSQYYGESGLYNALYQSNLTIDDVRIDNRVATIRLSGQVVLGGVCDTPRVKAQLEQIALQFSTVDQVNIFVNGEPLDDVLN